MESQAPHSRSESSLGLHLLDEFNCQEKSLSSATSLTGLPRGGSGSDTSSSLADDDDETTSSSSSSSSSSAPSLQSLAEFIHTNLKPFGQNGYNAYATSYITSVIPRLDFFPGDTESYSGDLPPFPLNEAVKVKEYQIREERRKELGKSSRQNCIIPDSKSVLKEINLLSSNKSNESGKTQQKLAEKHNFLFYKARQWCDINKALHVDGKYPKIGPKVIRKKFSDEYQIACRKARKAAGISDKDKVYRPNIIKSFPIPLELVTTIITKADKNLNQQDPLHIKESGGESIRKMSLQVENEEKDQFGLGQKLRGIFVEIKPIPNSTVTEANLPWQFVARKTATIEQKRVAKPPFKRTEYPPVSKIQKIAQLRKLLPPPKPPEMETDYLSGIWEPVLEIDDFHITPPGGAVEAGPPPKEAEDMNWFKCQEAKEKCKRWLDANPDIL